MTIWNLRGTDTQQQIVREALDLCDFPFEQLRPSLEREGKQAIDVDWEDLSRYNHGAAAHEHAEGAHTVVREVDGRARVLGLFYLPPYTRVVLDASLVGNPPLAREVFLAEAAHAVDYHFMAERGLRRDVWNALHGDHEDTAVDVPEAGDVSHGHSWFDGPGGYSTWAGEAFMMAFTKAWAPSVPVTIQLAHPVSDEAAAEIRAAMLGAIFDEVFGLERSAIVHDDHRGIDAERTWPTLAAAVADGRRPCRVCKPKETA